MANRDAKVVLLGKNYSGKSCLMERYLHDKYHYDDPIPSTIGVDFGEKRAVIGDKSLLLEIWDTAGTDRDDAVNRIICRGAMAAIICYDLTDSGNFDKAKFWANELRTHEVNCEIFLCGTKLDLIKRGIKGGEKLKGLKRAVDYDTTTDYAYEIHAKFFETSSLTGENVGKLFHEVGKTCLEKLVVKAPKGKEILSLTLEEPIKQRQKRC